MAAAQTCPKCGAELPIDALGGLCPKCLGKVVFGITAGPKTQPAEFHPPPGTKVRYFGDYELLEEVGRGGMGAVYRARQVSLNRVVALKMMLAGQFASEAEVRRFQTEAEAAANLDHPNIVPIYEIGEHEGQHYFSMKFVEGRSLAQELKDGLWREKDHRDIARLVAAVARAVHCAHQRGILHRDLKPGNILLDSQGQPQVTDFGLAKRVEVDSSLTFSGAIIGTPHYMAPEQAAGNSRHLTTAADIYSLGVVLYELLTGKPPFEAESPLEVMRQVMEQEPKRPSAIMRRVDRDLETICLKCLEKQPQRRYASADALADDLERWLRGEPILARHSGTLTHIAKWARRNPAIASLAAAVVVVAAVGFVGVAWQWREAKAEARKSQEVARFLEEMLAGVGPGVALGRDTALLREILDKTAERIDKDLKAQPEVEAEVRAILASVYQALDQLDKAEAIYRRVLEIHQKLQGARHPDTARSQSDLAAILYLRGDLTEAQTLFGEALKTQTNRLGAENLDVARTYNNLGLVLHAFGKVPEAETIHREALRVRRKLLGETNLDVAVSLSNVATELWAQGKLDEAERLYRQVFEIRTNLLSPKHPDVALTLNNLGTVLANAGKLPEAEAAHRRAFEMQTNLFGPVHSAVASSLNNLAPVLQRQGRVAEAVPLQRQAVDIFKQVLPAKHPRLAMALGNLGAALHLNNQFPEAENYFRQALAMQIDLFGRTNLDVAQSLNNLAFVVYAQGRVAEAESMHREALQLRRFLNAPLHVAISLNNLAQIYWMRGDPTNAAPLYREALAMRLQIHGNKHPDLAMALNNLGTALRDMGELAEAEDLHRRALAMQQEIYGSNTLQVAGFVNNLMQVLQKVGKFQEAERLQRQELEIWRANLPPGHPQLAASLISLANLYREQGRWSDAEPPARECLDIREKQAPDDWSTFNTRSVLGACLLGQKKYAAAEPLLVSGYEGMAQRESQIPAAAKARLREALERLVELHEATGRTNEAAVWKQKLADLQPAPVEKNSKPIKP